MPERCMQCGSKLTSAGCPVCYQWNLPPKPVMPLSPNTWQASKPTKKMTQTQVVNQARLALQYLQCGSIEEAAMCLENLIFSLCKQ